LTQRIRALRAAEQIRDDHLHDPAPWTVAEWALACGLTCPQELRKVIRQGQEARSQLVQANMGLVTAIAKRQYSSLKHALEAGNGVGTILTLQDFLQEGQIGLIKAAERFDPSREVRFGTYATWWIRQRILRSISDSSRIIRLPAHSKFDPVHASVSALK
jgi:DNA-directed RNA polymerase sigma subunit (sigma70/sigma32)